MMNNPARFSLYQVLASYSVALAILGNIGGAQDISQQWQVPTQIQIGTPTHSFDQYDESQGTLESASITFDPGYHGSLFAHSSASPGNFNGWSYHLNGEVRLHVDGVTISAPFNFEKGGVVQGPGDLQFEFMGQWDPYMQLAQNLAPFVGTGSVFADLTMQINTQEFVWSHGGSSEFVHRYGGDTTVDYHIASSPIAEELIGVSASSDSLVHFDLTIATATPIGKLGASFVTPVAMAVSPHDETVYVWSNSTKSQLLEVAPATGAAYPVDPNTADLGTSVGALAMDVNNVLFGFKSALTGDELFEIDRHTGAEVRSLGVLDKRIAGADFGDDGFLYALTIDATELLRIDPTDGQVATSVVLSEDLGIGGSIVFSSDGTLLASAFTQSPSPTATIFRINPLTGGISDPVSLASPAGIQGLGYISQDSLARLPADFDQDGDVDADDLLEWTAAYANNDNADADRDGDSDGHDFLIWQQEYGFTSPAITEVLVVPEPIGDTLAWGLSIFLCLVCATRSRQCTGCAASRR